MQSALNSDIVVQIIVRSVIGHDFTKPDTAFDLHLLHLSVDQFLYHERIFDIFQHQCGHGLVRRKHRNGTHAKQTLPQIPAGINIPDTVQKNLIILQIQKPFGNKQTVFRQTIIIV